MCRLSYLYSCAEKICMFLRASDNPSGLYTPACALSQTPAERHAALTEAQTRSSSTQLPSQVARPPATLTYFFIYVESRDIFGFLSPVILLLYFFTIPSNTSTWSCGAEVKWRLKRWATKSNRVHLKLCRGSTLTPSGHG